MPVVLHLTDLHFGRELDATGRSQRSIALHSLIREIQAVEREWWPELIVISGDLSWQARTQGYDELADWLQGTLFPSTGLSSMECVICPGNHDIDRDLAFSFLDRTDDPDRADQVLSPERLATGLAQPFSKFVSFAKNLRIPPLMLHGESNYLVGVREISGLRFVCLNSAWFCRNSATDRGNLWLGLPQIQSLELADPLSFDAAPISIAVVHHPPEWLAQPEWTSYENRPATYSYLCERCHVILSGHTHGALERADRYSGGARLFLGGSTYDNSFYRNNISLLQIDPNSRLITRLSWEFDPRFQRWDKKVPSSYSLKKEEASRSAASSSIYLNWLRDRTQLLNLHQLNVGPGDTPPPTIESLYTYLLTGKAEYVQELAKPGEGVLGDTIQRSQYVPLEDALTTKHLVIEGKPGSGKSTFLQWIAWNLCRLIGPPRSFPLKGFPVLIGIRRLDQHISKTMESREPGDPTSEDDHRWIAHFMARQGWKLDEQFFANKLESDETVLLLDGLDEAQDRPHREAIVRLIQNVSSTYGCRIVVTARPGANQGRSTLHTFVSTHIEDLDDDGIERFLLRWSRWLFRGSEKAAMEYFPSLQASMSAPPIRKLAGNPLMLTALSVLHFKKHRLPEQRAQLYEEVIGWLADQAVEKHNGGWRKNDLLSQFGSLALAMQNWKGQKRIAIGIDTAAQILSKTGPIENAKRFLEDAQVESGIVTLNRGEIAFWHQSFQDYLTARVLVGYPDDKLREISIQMLYSSAGPEVLPLLAGRMAESAPERLELLLEGLVDHAIDERELRRKALTVVVLRAVQQDLTSFKYELSDCLSQKIATVLTDVQIIFVKGHAINIPLNLRVAAAEALDQSNNSRLQKPTHPEYWVPISPLTETARVGSAKVAKRLMIGKRPVTVWEYSAYLVDRGAEPPSDWKIQVTHPSWPVTRVSWADASYYCDWISETCGFLCRLPTKHEWEAAAGEKVLYPWSRVEGRIEDDQPNDNRCNFAEHIGTPSPVGMFPDGDAPCGASDMAGNVWEWTTTDYGAGAKVVKGGCWHEQTLNIQNSAEEVWYPSFEFTFLGFRCVSERD